MEQNQGDDQGRSLSSFCCYRNNDLVFQEADEDSPVDSVDTVVCVKHMENILKGNSNVKKTDIKTKTSNFQVDHEKIINKTLNSLKSAQNFSEEQYKRIRIVGSRLGISNGL